ncbi:MAG: transposase family protein [Phycisphaerales bacterium]
MKRQKQAKHGIDRSGTPTEPLCPRCGYCLTNSLSPPCSECGFQYDRVAPEHLPAMFHNVRVEHRLIRLIMLAYILMLVLGAYATLRSTIDWGDLFISSIFAATILLAIVLLDRASLSRHIKKSRSPLYDGTTNAGTYSMLALAIIAIPTLMLMAEIIDQLF